MWNLLLTLNCNSTWAVIDDFTRTQVHTRTHIEKVSVLTHSFQLHDFSTMDSTTTGCTGLWTDFPDFLHHSIVWCIVNPDLNIYSTDLGGAVSGRKSFTLQLPAYYNFLLLSSLIEAVGAILLIKGTCLARTLKSSCQGGWERLLLYSHTQIFSSQNSNQWPCRILTSTSIRVPLCQKNWWLLQALHLVL